MQISREGQLPTPIEDLLASEWDRLVRLCASLSGNPDVAEDLAQESMIEAWRHAGGLRDPHAVRPWLSGIARNVCLRWLRRQGQESAKIERFVRYEGICGGETSDTLTLERDELACLLDRAMGLLPAPTRDVLVQHYIEGRPHGEIGDRLGMSESAVGVRIHRGKLALKQILAGPELSAGAVAYGLVDPADVGWQETHIWCPFCGRHRIAVRIDHTAGTVAARCTGPCFLDGTVLGGKLMTAGTSTMTSVKSILRRELIDLHGHYREALAARGRTCRECGRPLALDQWPPDGPGSLSSPYAYGVLMICPTCRAEDSAPLSHLLLDTPLVQQFWRRHPRMRVLPVRQLERDGRPALLSGFASVDATATIEVVSAADTFEILHVDGAVNR